LPKKKEKVVTLRMDQESFKTVEDYAKGKGLSVSAYINSVLDSYIENLENTT
jgi:predicted DNA binding CopG/RHH family protein